FSSAGPSWRHGPHHVAQKSTITGVEREASITSAAKLASVPSLITSAGGAPWVSPIRVMPALVLSANWVNVLRSRWSHPRCASTRGVGHARHGCEIHHDRAYADRRQEAAEAFAGNGRGRGVGQRVEVDE